MCNSCLRLDTAPSEVGGSSEPSEKWTKNTKKKKEKQAIKREHISKGLWPYYFFNGHAHIINEDTKCFSSGFPQFSFSSFPLIQHRVVTLSHSVKHSSWMRTTYVILDVPMIKMTEFCGTFHLFICLLIYLFFSKLTVHKISARGQGNNLLWCCGSSLSRTFLLISLLCYRQKTIAFITFFRALSILWSVERRPLHHSQTRRLSKLFSSVVCANIVVF